MFRYVSSYILTDKTIEDQITFDDLVEKITTPKLVPDKYKSRKEYDKCKNCTECYYPNHYNNLSTGYIYLDIDGFKSRNESVEYRSALLENPAISPYIKACWLSLSGYGLAILVRVKGMQESNYDDYWDELYQLFDKKLDSNAKG